MIEIATARVMICPTSRCEGRGCWYCSHRSGCIGLDADIEDVARLCYELRLGVKSGIIVISDANVSGGGEPLLYPYLSQVFQHLALLHPASSVLVCSGPLDTPKELTNLLTTMETWLEIWFGEVRMDGRTIPVPGFLPYPQISCHDDAGALTRLFTYLVRFAFPHTKVRFRSDPRVGVQEKAEGITRMQQTIMAAGFEMDVKALKAALGAIADAQKMGVATRNFSFRLLREGRSLEVLPMEILRPIGRARTLIPRTPTMDRGCHLLNRNELNFSLGWNGKLCPCTLGNVYEQPIRPANELIEWTTSARALVRRTLDAKWGSYIHPCDVCPYWREPQEQQ